MLDIKSPEGRKSSGAGCPLAFSTNYPCKPSQLNRLPNSGCLQDLPCIGRFLPGQEGGRQISATSCCPEPSAARGLDENDVARLRRPPRRCPAVRPADRRRAAACSALSVPDRRLRGRRVRSPGAKRGWWRSWLRENACGGRPRHRRGTFPCHLNRGGSQTPPPAPESAAPAPPGSVIRVLVIWLCTALVPSMVGPGPGTAADGLVVLIGSLP